MTYLFGDIHGCMQSFESLLTLLEPTSEDTIITLGDYVDRGPDSRGVITRILALQEELTVISLRGNHEKMMTEALNGPPASGFWMMNGGFATLDSYRARTLRDLPEEHWAFLANLKPYHLVEPFLITHATPPPQKQLNELTADDFYWSRFTNLSERCDGRFLICGHTPTASHRPESRHNHLCIDTGCCHDGYLTALTLETGDYIQANESGDLRDGQVTLPPLRDAIVPG